MSVLIKFRRAIFLMAIPFLFVCLNMNVQAKNMNVGANGQGVCFHLNDNVVLKKTKPGYYYFMSAICGLPNIHNRQTMNGVVQFLRKSIGYNYQLSHYVLATLYEDKFTSGSKFYGVKGEPIDLLIAIEQYKKAAAYGSAMAENALGVIYLDYANLSDENNGELSLFQDVKKGDITIKLPDLDSAIYWLTKAAQGGNAAAQGTLSDLYRQGIGVPQNFVLAYVWQNLCAASQSRFNPRTQDPIGRKLNQGENNVRDVLYSKLTDEQKNQAQFLLTSYTRDYFRWPNQFDRICRKIQMMMAAQNLSRIFHSFNVKK